MVVSGLYMPREFFMITAGATSAGRARFGWLATSETANFMLLQRPKSSLIKTQEEHHTLAICSLHGR